VYQGADGAAAEPTADATGSSSSSSSGGDDVIDAEFSETK
jgi:hypothetical protein